MNYLAHLNGYRIARMTKPISTNAVALYFILMEYDNALCWQEWFTVPNSTLQGLSGLSLKSLQRARSELIQKGYIAYKKGLGNQAGKYLIVPFDQQIDQQSVQQSVQQLSRKVSTLNKTRTRTKQENTPHTPPGEPPPEKPSINGAVSLAETKKRVLAYTDHAGLQEALMAFAEMRQSMRCALTGRALELIFNKLDQLGEADSAAKMAIVNQSVERGWRGVFAIKGEDLPPEKVWHNFDNDKDFFDEEG